MQQTLRPYLTTGIAVVGAGLIAVAPAAPQLPDTQQPAVTLTATDDGIFTPWVDLFNNTANNLAALGYHTFDFPILTQILTHPTESFQNAPNAISLLTELLPNINAHLVPFPPELSVGLPPWLTVAIAEVGPWVNVYDAFNEIVTQISSDPANALTEIIDAPAILLNAYLNGQGTIDVLDANVPAFNGILAPSQPFDAHLELGQLVDALGFGHTTLTGLLDQLGVGDTSVQTLLTDLLDALGFGDKTPVGLLDQFGLGNESVASLAITLLNAAGIGNPTISGLADQVGIGKESIATLLISLLNSAGIGNPSITGLLQQVGLGDLSLGGLLKDVLNAAGIGNPTITALIEQLGGGNLTLGGLLTDLVGNTTVSSLLGQLGMGSLTVNDVVTSLLSQTAIGQQSLAELIEQILGQQFGTGPGVTLGDLVIKILQQEGYDLTLAQVLQNAQLSNETLGELLRGQPIAGEPFTTLIGPIGQQTLQQLGNLSDFTCLGLGALHALAPAKWPLCGDTLNSLLGNNSVYDTLHNLTSAGNDPAGVPAGTPLTDVTLGQLLTATGQANEKLSDIVTGLNLNTPLDTMLNYLNLDNVNVETVLTNTLTSLGLGNTTVDTLLNDWGAGNVTLGTVIDHLGLNNLNIVSLLSDLGLNKLAIDTVIDSLLGHVQVGSLLDDLNLNNVHLDDVLNALLSSTTIGSLLTDLGLNSVNLDTVVANLGLGSVTIDSIFNDLGIGSINVDTLLNNLGLADFNLLDLAAGEFSGLANYVFVDLPDQVAQALGAAA